MIDSGYELFRFFSVRLRPRSVNANHTASSGRLSIVSHRPSRYDDENERVLPRRKHRTSRSDDELTLSHGVQSITRLRLATNCSIGSHVVDVNSQILTSYKVIARLLSSEAESQLLISTSASDSMLGG
jgi:hypothetical protein